MVSCKACGRSKTKQCEKNKITFHLFPKDMEKQQMWLKFLNEHNSSAIVATNMYLCSLHFSEECFDTTSPFRKRLMENAVPTIKINRFKYVRSFYPEECLVQTPTVPSNNAVINKAVPSSSTQILCETLTSRSNQTIPTTSIKTPTASSDFVLSTSSTSSALDLLQIQEDDTSHEVSLKRKLIDMHAKDRLNTKKIRYLQGKLWDQKKRINSLVTEISELKKKKFLNKDSCDAFLESFEGNKDLLRRLFKKSTYKSVDDAKMETENLEHEEYSGDLPRHFLDDDENSTIEEEITIKKEPDSIYEDGDTELEDTAEFESGTNYSDIVKEEHDIKAEYEENNKSNVMIEEVYIKTEHEDEYEEKTEEFTQHYPEFGTDASGPSSINYPLKTDLCTAKNKNASPSKEINIKSEPAEVSQYEEEELDNIDDANNETIGYEETEKIRPHKCEVCQRGFTFKSALIRHFRIHTGEKPFKCDQCNLAFSHYCTLITHKMKHSGVKPFKCEECDKAFSQKSTLSVHKRIHSGVRPFKCKQCQKSFFQKSALVTHIQLHNGEKRFKCQICEMTFNRNYHLLVHTMTHTGEKPFSCDQCSRTFSQKSTLTTHKRTHSGERPYKCEVCGKYFAQTSALSVHKRSHTGERPFKCNLCDKAYSRRMLLRDHHKYVHLKSIQPNLE